MMPSSSCLMDTALELMERVQEVSQGAGQILPVSSGNGLVISRRCQASRQRPR